MSVLPRILLVDDDRFWLETLAEFLRRKGFVVHQAQNAGEALEFLDREEVALVISDYQLPGMNGLHLLRRLRQRRQKAAVIVLSSEDEPTLSARVLSAGAVAFLEKSSAPSQLLRRIRQVINSLPVKELAAPTLALWQRLLPNPYRQGRRNDRVRPISGSANGTPRRARQTQV